MNTSRLCFRSKLFCCTRACLAASLLLAEGNIYAQSTDQAQRFVADSSKESSAVPSADGVTVTPNKANSSDPNAALLNELQQMRARIEQLEKQLKEQSAGKSESPNQ